MRHPGYAHGVPEGALPERLCAAVLSSRHGQHRPSDPLHRQLQPLGHPRAAAGHQLSNAEFTPTDEGVRFGPWACAASARTWPRPSSRSEPMGPVQYVAARLVNRPRCEVQLQDAFKGHHAGVRLDGLHAQQLMYFCRRDAAARKRDEAPEGPRARAGVDVRPVRRRSRFGLRGRRSRSRTAWSGRSASCCRSEKEIMKIHVSDHPLRPYEGTIARMTKFSIGDLAERNEGDQVRVRA